MKAPSLSTVVNVVLLLVALLIGGLHLRTYLTPAPAPGGGRPNVQKGQKAPVLPGVDYRSGQTLVMFLHSKCQYCTQSMPFYRTLKDRRSSALRFVIATRDTEGVMREYLAAHDLDVDVVAPIGEGGDPRLYLTPTLFLVSQNGVVENVWVGALEPSREADVTNALARVQASTRP